MMFQSPLLPKLPMKIASKSCSEYFETSDDDRLFGWSDSSRNGMPTTRTRARSSASMMITRLVDSESPIPHLKEMSHPVPNTPIGRSSPMHEWGVMTVNKKPEEKVDDSSDHDKLLSFVSADADNNGDNYWAPSPTKSPIVLSESKKKSGEKMSSPIITGLSTPNTKRWNLPAECGQLIVSPFRSPPIKTFRRYPPSDDTGLGEDKYMRTFANDHARDYELAKQQQEKQSSPYGSANPRYSWPDAGDDHTAYLSSLKTGPIDHFSSSGIREVEQCTPDKNQTFEEVFSPPLKYPFSRDSTPYRTHMAEVKKKELSKCRLAKRVRCSTTMIPSGGKKIPSAVDFPSDPNGSAYNVDAKTCSSGQSMVSSDMDAGLSSKYKYMPY